MTVRHVMRRELLARTRSKAFRIGTGILVLVAVAAPVALSVFDDDVGAARSITLGLVEVDPDVVDLLTAASGDDIGGEALEIETRAYGSRDESVAGLREGVVDVVLADDELIWEEDGDPVVTAVVGAARRQVAATRWAAENDLDPVSLAQLGEAGVVEETLLDDGGEVEDVRSAVSFLTALATFAIIVTYGPLVATSVVEEKATRVVEVLLSRITAGQLLAGKVLGVGIAVLAQVVIVLAGLGAALAVTSSVTVPSSVWGALPIMLAALLLGFGLYAVLYAAAGSLVSRQEDVQQTTMPLMVPIFVAYFYASFTLGGESGPIDRVLAFVPLTSPVMLPGLYARGAISTPEALASLAVLAATTVLLVRIAAGIYERSLLRTGSKVPWREAVRRPGAGTAPTPPAR